MCSKDRSPSRLSRFQLFLTLFPLFFFCKYAVNAAALPTGMIGRGCCSSSHVQDLFADCAIQSVGVPGGRYRKDRTLISVSQANCAKAASIKELPLEGKASQALYSA